MDAELPVWVERLLIGLAICFSALLAVITGVQHKFKGRHRVELFLVGVMATGCILCFLIGFFLFLSGRISLDAFGLVLIGLFPAFEATGKLRIGAYLAMRRRPALHNRISTLSYVRHGKALEPGVLGENLSKATTYIRVPASSKAVQKILSPFGTTSTDDNIWGISSVLTSSQGAEEKDRYSVLPGQVLKFDDNVVVLRDFNDTSDAVRWWKKANEALEVVQDPSKILLQSRETATRALELIAEISRIGDAIFNYHGESLRNYAKHSTKLSKALHGTPASVCNAFLDAVGLMEEWGPVDDGLKITFAYHFDDLRRRKQYGMLFFILLTESVLFHAVVEKTSDGIWLADANEVIHCFQDCADTRLREHVTLQWLSRYRLNKDRLDKYRQDNGPGDIISIPATHTEGGVTSSGYIVAVHPEATHRIPQRRVPELAPYRPPPSTARGDSPVPATTGSRIGSLS